MTTSTKVISAIGVVWLLVLSALAGSSSFRQEAAKLGTQVQQESFWFNGGLLIGPFGTQINNVIEGQCTVYLHGNTTISGTTTQAYDCGSSLTASKNSPQPITGVKPGDMVLINNASTTGAFAAGTGLDTVGVVASSTSGLISILFSNQTGATFTWPTTASTTINFIDFR